MRPNIRLGRTSGIRTSVVMADVVIAPCGRIAMRFGLDSYFFTNCAKNRRGAVAIISRRFVAFGRGGAYGFLRPALGALSPDSAIGGACGSTAVFFPAVTRTCGGPAFCLAAQGADTGLGIVKAGGGVVAAPFALFVTGDAILLNISAY